MMLLGKKRLKLPSTFLTVLLVFGKWIYTRGTQLFADYLLPGVYGATTTVLKCAGELVYHFVYTVTLMCGEWIYVFLKILKCTVPQTVSAFLHISEPLVQAWQLAISPLLTAIARTVQSIAHVYTSSESLGGWVKHLYNAMIDSCFHGVEDKMDTVRALLMVLCHVSLHLFHMACKLLVVTATTLLSILNSLLQLTTVYLFSLAMTCARYLVSLLTWFYVGLKILAHLAYHVLLLLMNLIRFSGPYISSITWNCFKFLLATARDILYSIYEFTYMFIKHSYFTSIAFTKDTAQLIYRLLSFLLYDVLPWILQFISDFVWTVVVQLWAYKFAVGVPLLILTVVVVTVWLTRVADSAKRRRNSKHTTLLNMCRYVHGDHYYLFIAQSSGVHCNMCMTPWCTKQRCKQPTRDGYYNYCSITCRDSYISFSRRKSTLSGGKKVLILIRWVWESGRCTS